ncbi:recombinase family protein [Mucilaginibacter sp. McL0603]|uniref:recombinase family protein n=1 Tax=Mucilaginibacter sp. McL0603 TaxID=3415670 RepID=UPI003CF3978E
MRLSIRDQSRYSLEYQEESIRDYCRRNNIELTALFKDNGESSYTFDRPDYKAVEAFVKKHKGQNQYFIIMDHDRFSRNLSEALSKITELEVKFGIKVIATNEPIDIDPDDPNVFMQRAFRYLIANEELLRIRKRTKQGMRHAQESGRYVNRAPFGYINVKDVSDKSTLAIDEPRAMIIQKIYDDYLSGIPMYLIYKEVKAIGFTIKGNSAIQKVLSNCVYAGLIKVPADKKRPDRYVKAIHLPIVSEPDFWIVQEMLGNKRPSKAQPEERFPLRGILKCWCGLHMTAGFSKGKRNYYLYYRCIKHTNNNISGITLHNQFNDLLRSLSFSQDQLKTITKMVSTKLKTIIGDKENELATKSKELLEINKKIEKLEARLMNDEIEPSTYKNWFQKYSSEKALTIKDITRLKNSGPDKWQQLERFMPALTNVFDIYEKAKISAKINLVKGVFKHNLVYSEGAFRTPSISEAFAYNSLIAKEKGLLFVEQPLVFSGQNPFSSP